MRKAEQQAFDFDAAAAALTPVEALAISKAIRGTTLETVNAQVPDGVLVPVDVTVRIQGLLKRGTGFLRRPTTRVLKTATLALLIRRLGIQREAALALLRDVLLEAHALDEAAAEILLTDHPEVTQAFEAVAALADTLPPIEVRGAVTFENASVTKV